MSDFNCYRICSNSFHLQYYCWWITLPLYYCSNATSSFLRWDIFSHLLWLVIVNFFPLSVTSSVYYKNNDPCIMVNLFMWWCDMTNIRVTITSCLLIHSYNNHSTFLNYHFISLLRCDFTIQMRICEYNYLYFIFYIVDHYFDILELIFTSFFVMKQHYISTFIYTTIVVYSWIIITSEYCTVK